jgi:O-antigen ligase
MGPRLWRQEWPNLRNSVIAIPAIAAFVLAGTFVAVASPSMLALAGAAAGLGLVALVSAVSPRVAVGLVFAASTLSGLTLPTPIGVLRIDQAIVLPALSGVLVRWISDRNQSLRADGRASRFLTIGLGMYLVANLFSTLLMALDVASSLRIVLWLSLSFAAYLLTITVAGRFCSVGTLLDDVVAIGTIAAGAALVLYFLAVLGVSSFGVQTDPVSGQLAAKGTLYEGNLLGSFAAMTAILAASQLVHSPGGRGRGRMLLKLSMVVCSAATYVTFTRAAWLGLAAGGLVIVLIGRPPSGRARIIVQGGLILAAAGMLLFVSGAGSQLVERVLSLGTDSTGTISIRVEAYAQALGGILDHLWLGQGTNSYGQHFLDPTQNYSRGYLGGLFIAALWDIGLVGLATLLFAFATVARKLQRGLASIDDAARSQAAGFSAAFVCGLVAYESTNGFWFAYNWILIGLAASIPIGLAVRAASQSAPGVDDALRSAGRPPTRTDGSSTAEPRQTGNPVEAGAGR